MHEYSGQVIESQCDYFTVSAHGEDRAATLEAYGRHLQKEAEAEGNDPSPWRTMGYAGTHCGHIDLGRRDSHSVILRVSGHPAGGCLSTALSAADNVTRLDVAVTWRAEPPDPLLGMNAYSLAELFLREHPRAGVPSQKRDALGGCTTYLNDQRSPYYARIYNKEAERLARNDPELAEHYRACWRYEVECHDARAMAVAEALDAREDTAIFCQQWVWDWFTKRGIPPAFPEAGAVALVEGFHRHTDDETRLRHLARNVAPTVRRLATRGKLPAVREALGLDSSNLLLTELERLKSQPWPTMGTVARVNGREKGDTSDGHGDTS